MRVAGLTLLLAGLANASPIFLERQQVNSSSPNTTVDGSSESVGANSTSGSSGNFTGSATIVSDAGNSTALPTAPFSWTLNSTVYNASSWQVQPYVANGYIGARLPAAGMGFQSFEAAADDPENGGLGWPLFGPRVTANMITGFFDVQSTTIGTNFPQNPNITGESVISLISTWTGLYVTLDAGADNETTYSAETLAEDITSFYQEFSIRNGTVVTQVGWAGVNLTYTLIAHRSRPNLGLVRVDISGLPADANITISDVLDGRGAARVVAQSAGALNASESANAIFVQLSPANLPNVTASQISSFGVISSDNAATDSSHSTETLQSVELPQSVTSIIGAGLNSTANQSYAFTASHGTLSFWKAVGIASTDAFSDARATALNATQSAREAGWDALVVEHGQAWDGIWDDEGGDIVIHQQSDAAADWQRITRASLFHLLANSRRGDEGPGLGDNSIAPAGLTSDSYAGSIFWDAETWMFPSLSSLFPKFAESILNYRNKLPQQYVANARESNSSGILYPWVSARYQRCSGIGPCSDYEYHLSNDIALSQWQYYQQTGNRSFLESQAWPIMKNISDFWANKVVKNGTSYNILNVTAPDEFANRVDNEAFTNAGAIITLRNTIAAADILGFQDQVGANWTEIADNIPILETTDADGDTIILEFDGFNGTTLVKQADVALLSYPLEFAAEKDPLADLEYYAGATSPNGPGMTYSIYAVSAAALSSSGCESYTRLQQSWQPYERQWSQFSEQTRDVYVTNGGTNPAYTFLTGHGGGLQVWTHGFTGYRSRTDRFFLDPSLPPQLAPEGFTVRGMQWHGSKFDVTVNGTTTSVLHRTGDGPAQVEVSVRNSRAGNYTLAVGETLLLETRRVDLAEPSYAGNLAQCAPSLSNVENVPGSIPEAAFDGSNATAWQPLTTDASSLTVDLGAERNITGIHVNWGKYPAATMSLKAGLDNATLADVITSQSINVSSPLDPATVAIVNLVAGNTTTLQLQNATSARYVELTVEGSATEGVAATVAELVVL